ncbi:hypothetical protein BC834DRAFT_969029 [Gloeopeniophorella convolvens]|nr:hypothetical protein BC834DRAFT_969029 [Gloeopeniophorella convolvens]
MFESRGLVHATGAELSVARINRLLRPLRNKCANLASAISRPSGSFASITYGSSSSTYRVRAPPSLDVLGDPVLVVSLAQLDSRSLHGSLEGRARQVYAVADAYRNIVQASFPGDAERSGSGTLALTDVCAAVVGRNIQAEVARCTAELVDEDQFDDAKEKTLIDELYESVPLRFRRWSLVAHATCVIVETCPNQSLLMLALLGISISHGLLHESTTFLRGLLTSIIRPPRPGATPTIAHPEHPSYLVNLYTEWTRSFTHRTFISVVLDVLAEHGTPEAWACKSVTRLAQCMRTRDFGAFLGFLRALIGVLSRHPTDDAATAALAARFAKWTGVIISDFFTETREPAVVDYADQFHAVVEILTSAHACRLHLRFVIDIENDDLDPRATLLCAVTHTIASPLFPTTSPAHQRTVLALFHETPPSAASFTTLASLPLVTLRTLTASLRAKALHEHEAALWTAALRYAERAGAAAAQRDALRDALEEAERCAARAREWEWEDMVGGWVQRSLADGRPQKRARRTTDGAERARTGRRAPLSRATSVSASVASTPPLSSASSSSSSSTSLAPSRGESPEVEVLDEDAAQRVARRRSSAMFRSVLADALKTRTDLNVKRRASLRFERRYSSDSEAEKEEEQAPALPSDGDVLDLFAYPD